MRNQTISREIRPQKVVLKTKPDGYSRGLNEGLKLKKLNKHTSETANKIEAKYTLTNLSIECNSNLNQFDIKNLAQIVKTSGSTGQLGRINTVGFKMIELETLSNNELVGNEFLGAIYTRPADFQGSDEDFYHMLRKQNFIK